MGINYSRDGNRRSVTPPPDLQRTGNGAQCRVYLALADRCNDAGVCWPSLARLSADTGLHRTTVCKALKWLETNGHVVRTQRRVTEELWQSTSYLLAAQARGENAGGGVVANPPLLVANPLLVVAKTLLGGSSQNATGGSSQNATQTLLSKNTSQKDLSTDVATLTPWDVAKAAIDDLFPQDAGVKAKGFATELVKVAKRSGQPVDRLARLAAAVMALHGVTVDTLSNPSRSALLIRLDSLLALTPTDKALKARWAALSGRRGWPGDIGQRLERLIAQWNTLDVGSTPLAASEPSSAARQKMTATTIRGRLRTSDDPTTATTQELPA